MAVGGSPSDTYSDLSNGSADIGRAVVGLSSQGESSPDMTALSAVLTHRHRISLLEALRRCDKTIPAAAAMLRTDSKGLRHHAEVLRNAGLLRRYRRRLYGVRRKDKAASVYGLTPLGVVALEYYTLGSDGRR